MKSQYIVTLLVLSIFALSRVGVAQQTAEKNGNEFEPGKVLAIVGGEPIFVGDLLFDANQFLEKNAPGAPESARAELRPQIIQRMLPSYINQQILIHTPHLEDKYQGTRMILDMLKGHSELDRSRVLVDHVEEHTVELVLEAGFWAGMTLYPVTKCTPSRAADVIEKYGTERLCVNSAGDWGPSKPTAVPDFVMEMRRRGHSEAKIRGVVYDNPHTFFSQSKNFSFAAPV